jgi:hypothetical protein
MKNNDMHPTSSGTDEALWDAYRRDDKAAVMDYLFRRSLVGIGRSRSFPRLVIQTSSKERRAARRAHHEPRAINDGARRIPLGSTLN